MRAAVPDPLPRVAIHEAGHVVAAAALGLPAEGVRLLDGGGGEALVPFEGTGEGQVKVSLAGLVAEAVAGYPITDPERLEWDLRVARDLCNLMGRRVADFVRPTRDLLRRHWSVVEDIAGVLAAQGELSARDLLVLVIANEAGGSSRERGAS